MPITSGGLKLPEWGQRRPFILLRVETLETIMAKVHET